MHASGTHGIDEAKGTPMLASPRACLWREQTEEAKEVVKSVSVKAVKEAIRRNSLENSDSKAECAKRVTELATLKAMQNVENAEETSKALPSGFGIAAVSDQKDKDAVETPPVAAVANLHHTFEPVSCAEVKAEVTETPSDDVQNLDQGSAHSVVVEKSTGTEALNAQQEAKPAEDKRGGLFLEELFEARSVWKVVGGAMTGGIVVRQGKDTKSKALDRLSHGALIEELQLVDDRLEYKLLTGSGPSSGWVTIKLNGKPLCEKQ